MNKKLIQCDTMKDTTVGKTGKQLATENCLLLIEVKQLCQQCLMFLILSILSIADILN